MRENNAGLSVKSVKSRGREGRSASNNSKNAWNVTYCYALWEGVGNDPITIWPGVSAGGVELLSVTHIVTRSNNYQ